MRATENRLDSVKRAKTLGLSVVEGGDHSRERMAQRRAAIAVRVAQLGPVELGYVTELLDKLGG